MAPDLASLRRKIAALVETSRAAGAGEPKPEIADFVAGRRDTLPEWVTGPWIVGVPDEAKERIRALRELGVEHLMLWFMDAPDLEGMGYFMSEVAPSSDDST